MDTIALATLTAILGAFLGAWVGHRLARSTQKDDETQKTIRLVVENYISGKYPTHAHTIPRLMASGAAQLETVKDLNEACRLIDARGHRDPLIWARQHLNESELLEFIRWHAIPSNYAFEDYNNIDSFGILVARFKAQTKKRG